MYSRDKLPPRVKASYSLRVNLIPCWLWTAGSKVLNKLELFKSAKLLKCSKRGPSLATSPWIRVTPFLMGKFSKTKFGSSYCPTFWTFSLWRKSILSFIFLFCIYYYFKGDSSPNALMRCWTCTTGGPSFNFLAFPFYYRSIITLWFISMRVFGNFSILKPYRGFTIPSKSK